MTKKKPAALHHKRSDSAIVRARKQLNTDGWSNIYTGQGIEGKDKFLGTSFGRVARFTEQQLSDLYRGDGFAKRIIDFPTGEMIREWFEVNGDTDGDINKYLATIRTRQAVLMALRWARLHGGAIVVMIINDGGSLDTPLNEANVRGIEAFHIYERWRITWTTADLYQDPNDPKFGTLEYYHVSPVSEGGISPFTVHETRILKFDGMPVSNKVRQENNGWGDSYIQSVYNELANLTGSFYAARNVLDDFVQILIKIENLQELIAAGNEALVRKRLEIIDMGRHMMNTIMLDAREDYEKHSSSIAGMSDVLQKMGEALSTVTEIPMTLLFGQSPKGFNAKDDGSLRKWYDKVAQDQEDELRPNLERLVYLSMISKEGPTSGSEIKDWSITFNPLWQPTEQEIVDMRNKQAETDKIYIDSGVLFPEEVATSRFGGDEYSIETKLTSTESRERPQKIPFGMEPEPEPDDDDEDEE